MIIDKNISKYLILDAETLGAGLSKIESNEDGIIFGVTPEGVLTGVLTDGDFRRWAMTAEAVDINSPLSAALNTVFVSASIHDSKDRIAALLDDRISFLPLVDDHQRCVAMVRRRQPEFFIGGHKVGRGHPAFIVAEIGNNHNGSLDLAKTLVDKAVAVGADCAKFQMRDLSVLYKNAGDANDASEDLNTQYTLDLLSRFQLSTEEMFEVFDYCASKGIMALCTPWDENSLAALERYGIKAYKTASADLTNHPLLTAIAQTGKPMLCSTGMSTEAEIADAVRLLHGQGAELALLHCNATYPAPFRDVNLGFMEKLRQIGECPVGYSSHDRGNDVCVAAVAMGANIIEKHFTLDRDMEGSDHRVSLLPDEFGRLVTSIRQVEEALGAPGPRRLSQGEMMNREALGKSLVISCNLDVGEVIQDHMLDIRSPGRGLPPYRVSDVIGRAAKRKLSAGDILFEADIADTQIEARAYAFNRPFGIPVRYHDMDTLGRMSNFDLLEFHLSYKDMDEDISKYFSGPLDMDFAVHAPELFAGDHLLDLCSEDADYRAHSVEQLARVIDITRRLREYFPSVATPGIIVNAGGFTQDAPLPVYARKERYEKILDSLDGLDTDGVEIWPQTMPPFPWHFGGQRFQNLFMDPQETADICAASGLRVCLDTSHSKLACTHHNWSFADFIRLVGPHTAHLHIADSSGVDGEGLQIGDGEIALEEMCRCLKDFAPGASFIPEIWQGHKNGGEGFWVALERLERYL